MRVKPEFRSVRHASEDVATVNRVAAVPTILDVICRTTGMGFAAIARVTEDQWLACAVRDEINLGLQPGEELDVQTTICGDIRTNPVPVVIDDVETDANYSNHRKLSTYAFRSYISIPIFRGDGSFFGTLCAIDRKPISLNRPEIIGMFRLFADLLGFHIDATDKLEDDQKIIAQQRDAHNVRDQFIAVLGHDLRNPLAAFSAGINLLRRTNLDEQGKQTVALMNHSVRRMAELIDNVLDFARGRLGGGISITRATDKSLSPILQQVVSEMQSGAPGRTIKANIDLHGHIDCDPDRIGQMLSNLIGNALAHGDKQGPIVIHAENPGHRFALSVSNFGPPITAEVRDGMFEPFSRSRTGTNEGLGLGLYICSEIARAHGGILGVKSENGQTTFTFTMLQE